MKRINQIKRSALHTDYFKEQEKEGFLEQGKMIDNRRRRQVRSSAGSKEEGKRRRREKRSRQEEE